MDFFWLIIGFLTKTFRNVLDYNRVQVATLIILRIKKLLNSTKIKKSKTCDCKNSNDMLLLGFSFSLLMKLSVTNLFLWRHNYRDPTNNFHLQKYSFLKKEAKTPRILMDFIKINIKCSFFSPIFAFYACRMVRPNHKYVHILMKKYKAFIQCTEKKPYTADWKN